MDVHTCESPENSSAVCLHSDTKFKFLAFLIFFSQLNSMQFICAFFETILDFRGLRCEQFYFFA